MQKPLIEFCMLNLGNSAGSKRAKEQLEKDSSLKISTFGCLHKCSTCFRGPYALVNDEIVTGDTPEQLVENIYRHVNGVLQK